MFQRLNRKNFTRRILLFMRWQPEQVVDLGEYTLCEPMQYIFEHGFPDFSGQHLKIRTPVQFTLRNENWKSYIEIYEGPSMDALMIDPEDGSIWYLYWTDQGAELKFANTSLEDMFFNFAFLNRLLAMIRKMEKLPGIRSDLDLSFREYHKIHQFISWIKRRVLEPPARDSQAFWPGYLNGFDEYLDMVDE